jgi:voltage-gated potassium channel
VKTLAAQLATFLQGGPVRRNLRLLVRFVLLLLVMLAAYTMVFHLLAVYEGQDHSWITGLYWTLTVMSTLGFGDITFSSDWGRVFSMFVLVSGVVVLLIVLPFTFIQFFYAPWLEEQNRRRVAREVGADLTGHVILTEDGAVSRALVERLEAHHYPYFLIEPDLVRAMNLSDEGLSVVLGHRDAVETYSRLGADRAAMVVATGNDYENTNVAFTTREVSESVPIVTFARDPDALDVLELAGANHVLHLPDMLGRSLARRTLGGDVRANVMGRFGDLLVAEAPMVGTPVVGTRLGEGWLREHTGLTVLGVWERGAFTLARPEMVIEATMVLVLAGDEAQLARFSELVHGTDLDDAQVLILGGGRVGRAAARSLEERGMRYTIVEKNPAMVPDGDEHYVGGNAADRAVLDEAGIAEAATTMVTTADDATNIYLTIYCRRLRPEMQIVSRANLERNVSTLHRAGADFVMSYASMGAGAVFNLLEQGDLVMVAEGLDIFRVPVADSLKGRSLRESGIREATGASVVAVETAEGIEVNPPPGYRLPAEPDAEIILVGTPESQRAYAGTYAS